MPAASPRKISKKELAGHNSHSDLWINIHGRVYNLSAFIEDHPGGEEVLLEQAGKDGTEAFEDIGHSKDARDMMREYYVGEYAGDIVEEEDAKPEKSESVLHHGLDLSAIAELSFKNAAVIALGLLAVGMAVAVGVYLNNKTNKTFI